MFVFGETIDLAILFLITAVLYASVGQAGATGYLAAMGLVGAAPEVMKPTALALNIVVALIGTVQFWRAGQFSWRTFYPFGVLGIPFSLVGGAFNMPRHFYLPVIGVILLLAAVQTARSARRRHQIGGSHPKAPPFMPALFTGAVIGFVSGMTGTGGGIFLAPVILMMNWVEPRRAAAVTAAYNLLNSVAALAGAYATLGALPRALPWWLAVAAVGGAIGATFGSRVLPERALRLVLAGILAVSGLKLLFS
jgi:uncharacterized membrane protein YfcA